MSKKTQNIYAAIENLNNLQKQLADYNATIGDRKLNDIEFGLSQELKNLKFWIDSLYSYNGKSKSLAKKAASKENGRKGGRPPKAVTEAKKRISALEMEISDLEHSLKMSDFVDERQNLEEKIISKKQEISDLEKNLPN